MLFRRKLLYDEESMSSSRGSTPTIQTAKKIEGVRGHKISAAKVLVIGGGLAGLCACYEAAQAGAIVVLLEKEKLIGGNSARATSGITGVNTPAQAFEEIEDSCERLREDIIKSGGGLSDHKLVDALVAYSEESVSWLERMFGLDFSALSHCGGHSVKRVHRISASSSSSSSSSRATGHSQQPPPLPTGYATVAVLKRDLEELDSVTLITEARVVCLLTDQFGQVSSVTGVQYEHDGIMKRMHADAVVIAAGGFAFDKSSSHDSLLVEFAASGMLSLPTTSGPQADGSGIKMARNDVNAHLVHMDQVGLQTGFISPQDPDNERKVVAPEAMRGSGAILLNSDGHRFCNELDIRSHLCQQIFYNCSPDYGTTAYKVAYLVMNEEAALQFGVSSLNFYKGKRLMSEVAGTKGIAGFIGCEEKVIRETFASYSHAATEGHDEFGKTIFPVSEWRCKEENEDDDHDSGGKFKNANSHDVSISISMPGTFMSPTPARFMTASSLSRMWANSDVISSNGGSSSSSSGGGGYGGDRSSSSVNGASGSSSNDNGEKAGEGSGSIGGEGSGGDGRSGGESHPKDQGITEEGKGRGEEAVVTLLQVQKGGKKDEVEEEEGGRQQKGRKGMIEAIDARDRRRGGIRTGGASIRGGGGGGGDASGSGGGIGGGGGGGGAAHDPPRKKWVGLVSIGDEADVMKAPLVITGRKTANGLVGGEGDSGGGGGGGGGGSGGSGAGEGGLIAMKGGQAATEGRASEEEEGGRRGGSCDEGGGIDCEAHLYHVAAVTPCIQNTLGGIYISSSTEVLHCNERGLFSSVLGLFAAGECTGGTHGANRLAGNALLECVVFGRLAGKRAAMITQDVLPALDCEFYTPVRLRHKVCVSEKGHIYELSCELPSSRHSVFPWMTSGQYVAVKFEGEDRFYSPITRDDYYGQIDLLVKAHPQGGKMSQFLYNLKTGDYLEMRGPMGGFNFNLRAGDPSRIGMIAGGVGISGMVAVIRQCLHEDVGTKMKLVWGAEYEDDLIYRDVMDSQARIHPNEFEVTYVLNHPPEGWKGETGYITKDIIKAQMFPPEEGVAIVVCGPWKMCQLMKQMLKELGYTDDMIFSYM